MKRIVAGLLVVGAMLSTGDAQAISIQKVQGLIERIHAKVDRFAEQPILRFIPSPEHPVQGEPVTVFIQPESGYTKANIMLSAKLDTVDVALEAPTTGLWVFSSPGFNEIRGHELEVSLSIEDADEAGEIRQAIKQLDKDIVALQKLIDKTPQGPVKDDLIAQRDAKIALKNELLLALERLKTFVGTQSYVFNVGESVSNPDFPKITALNPNVGSVNGGTLVSVQGTNFAGVNQVVIAGVTLTPNTVAPTEVTFTTPSFSSLGAKDVELRAAQADGTTKNAILKNGFFAGVEPPPPTPIPNFAPVAVAGAAQSVALGQQATLNGLQSYDPNGDVFSYVWTLESVPSGSSLTPGVIGGLSQQGFLPDVPGVFVFSLTVQETNTSDLFMSQPSLTTVRALAPANSAPQLSAGAITARTGETKTVQIQLSDADAWQAHTLVLASTPSLGTASLDANRVLTYVAGANAGSESVRVVAVDNGTPALQGEVLIPVTISVNQAPVPTAPSITVSSGGVGTSQVVPHDPENDPVTYAIHVAPMQGTATVSSIGSVTYTSTAPYTGSDSLTVRVSDAQNPAVFGDVVIAINVVSGNQPPVITGMFPLQLTEGSPVRMRYALLNSSNDPDGSIARVAYTFSDAGRAFSSQPVGFSVDHDAVAFGPFSVLANARDNLGAETEFTFNLDLTPYETNLRPVNRVVVDTISGAAPLTVNFDATGTFDPEAQGFNTVRWLWGDGSPEQQGNSELFTNSHTFQNPGTYNVRFRVRDILRGETDTFIRIYVGATPPAGGTAPTADFKFTPREVVVGTPVTMDGSRSLDPNPNGGTLSYEWKAFDNIDCISEPGATCTYNTQVATHTFHLLGPQFPSLSVTNQNGATSGPRFEEVIVVNQGHAPRANFNLSPTSGVAPLTVNFNAGSGRSYDYDGTITQYRWTYGDSTPTDSTSGELASHTYAVPGVYFVNLEVEDNDLNVHRASSLVTVNSSLKVKPLVVDDEDRAEKRRMLTNACGAEQSEACYELAKMYEEDGDAFTAQKLFERACSLGYSAACQVAKWMKW